MPKTKRKAQDVPMLIKLFELGWFHLKKALRPFSSKSSVKSPKKSTVKLSTKSSVKSSVNSSVHSSVNSSDKSPVKSTVKSTVNSPVKSSEKCTVNSSVKSSEKCTVNSSVKSSVKSPVKSSEKSTVNSSVNSSVKISIKSPVKSSVKSPKKRFPKGDYWKRNTIIAISTISTIMVVSLIGIYAFFGRNYYDNSRAIKMLNSNARTYSNGLCAMYVRSAIEHGGAPTYGFPGNACDYVDFLPRLDFDKIADETTRDYKPQAGDIMVFAAQKGHKSGHIAMWNGKMWVSDFRQPRGMWVHPIYKSNPSWSVFRRPDGWAYRHISFSEMCALIRYLPTTTRNAIRRWHSEPASK